MGSSFKFEAAYTHGCGMCMRVAPLLFKNPPNALGALTVPAKLQPVSMVVRLTNLSLVTSYLLNIQGFTGVESARKVKPQQHSNGLWAWKC